MSRVLITPAAPNEQELALSLLFSDIPVQQRHLHVARALTVFASGEVDPRTCWLRPLSAWAGGCNDVRPDPSGRYGNALGRRAPKMSWNEYRLRKPFCEPFCFGSGRMV